MTQVRRIPRRNPACTAGFHSRWAHANRGCICPPSDADRATWRVESMRRATGPSRVRVSTRADVDQLAVDLIAGGEPLAMVTSAERLAAVAILTDRGLSAAEIALRLRCHMRTVERYRAAARARVEATSC